METIPYIGNVCENESTSSDQSQSRIQHGVHLCINSIFLMYRILRSFTPEIFCYRTTDMIL